MMSNNTSCGVYAPATIGGSCVETRCVSPTLRDTLRNKRASLESQLQEVNEAIAALDENPGVERVLDLITKTTRY